MKIVLADDAALFRIALARLLNTAGAEVVEACDVPALMTAVTMHKPDVVIVDVRMPPTYTTEGLEAALELRRHHIALPVLVLSQHIESHYAAQLFGDSSGGLGYLLKERVADDAELMDALERVAAGGSVIDHNVVRALLAERTAPNPLKTLSQREREVLTLIAEGRSNTAISARLHLTDKTVQSHVRNIFAKLTLPPAADDHRRVLAVLTYLRSPATQPSDSR